MSENPDSLVPETADLADGASLDERKTGANTALLWMIRFGTALYFAFMLLMLLHPDPWSILGFEPRSRLARSAFSFVHVAIFICLAIGVELGRVRRTVSFWLILLLVFGPISECIQTQTGRGFEWLDILQDTMGVIIGTIIGYVLHSIPFVYKILPFRRDTP